MRSARSPARAEPDCSTADRNTRVHRANWCLPTRRPHKGADADQPRFGAEMCPEAILGVAITTSPIQLGRKMPSPMHCLSPGESVGQKITRRGWAKANAERPLAYQQACHATPWARSDGNPWWIWRNPPLSFTNRFAVSRLFGDVGGGLGRRADRQWQQHKVGNRKARNERQDTGRERQAFGSTRRILKPFCLASALRSLGNPAIATKIQ